MRAWDQDRDLEALRRSIDRAFTSALNNNSASPFSMAFLPGRAARQYPLVNVSEDRDHFYVEALAPGLNPQTLEVSIVRNSLQVAGEKVAPQGVGPDAFHRSERAAGKFVRSIELPVEVDTSRVDARYADGLLTVVVSKAEEARPKRIEVSVA